MSFIAPLLPAGAPFSPLQRAWIDGFLAALFAESRPTAAADGANMAPAPVEDFPWHDPALRLDERLALAEGRPRGQVLMAAMAQLDCGQCGYLCQTYAEAIAGGAEAKLTRCAPGGRATSRALREALAAAPVAAAAAVPDAPAPSQPAALDAPAIAMRMVMARPLNGEGSEKDTRQVVLAAEGGYLDYEVGDSLGVAARNCPELVQAIVERLGATAETLVVSPDGTERPLAAALAGFCEIRRPSDQAIEVLASRAGEVEESRILQAIAEGYPGAGPEDADLLDLLEAYPSARPPLSELISSLDPLRPRLYSIASSPKHVVGEVHLTVAAVRYDKRARQRKGVASTFLCDRLPMGEAVPVSVQRGDGFRLAASDRPIIMIGPGTGIAPFRAFLQERQATGVGGRNWLFFGNPRRRSDFLYEKDLLAWHRDGLLTRLDTAFSRDQSEKLYVQHRMLEHAAELWSWLQDGACFYVCGDAEKMARDVDRALAWIVAREGRIDGPAAKAYVARLAAEGRYRRDVY